MASKQKQRRFLIIVSIFLLLAAIAIGVWYYFMRSPNKAEHQQKLIPHINMTKVNVTDIDGEHIKFNANFVLANPFPLNFTTHRIQYQVFIDTAMVIESTYDQSLDVKSMDSLMLALPMEASLKRMLNMFKEFKRQGTDSANYKVNMQVFLDMPVGGERQFDFVINKRLPAFMLPDLQLLDTDIKKFGLKESGVDIAVMIQNNNHFDLNIHKGKFFVTLDDDLELEGKLDDLSLPAKGKQIAKVHFDLKSERLGKTVWKVIFNKKDTKFNLVFKAVADAHNDIIDNTNITITAKGTLAEAIKAAKELK